jgi:hypothetical protein
MSLGRLFTASLAQGITEDRIDALKVLVKNPD